MPWSCHEGWAARATRQVSYTMCGRATVGGKRERPGEGVNELGELHVTWSVLEVMRWCLDGNTYIPMWAIIGAPTDGRANRWTDERAGDQTICGWADVLKQDEAHGCAMDGQVRWALERWADECISRKVSWGGEASTHNTNHPSKEDWSAQFCGGIGKLHEHGLNGWAGWRLGGVSCRSSRVSRWRFVQHDMRVCPPNDGQSTWRYGHVWRHGGKSIGEPNEGSCGAKRRCACWTMSWWTRWGDPWLGVLGEPNGEVLGLVNGGATRRAKGT